MPVGYRARCRVCNSPHRAKIEKWVKEDGLSPRAAAGRLIEEHGEKISHQSIWKHMQEHFDIKAETWEQYQKSQELMNRFVKKRLSDLEMLDNLMQSNYELHMAGRSWADEVVRQRGKLPQALVQLVTNTASEIRAAMKTKQEMLGEDTGSQMAETWSELIAGLKEGDDEGADDG
jgi:hypothetical protein